MTKIIIKRKQNKLKLQETKQKIVIRSLGKRGLPGPPGAGSSDNFSQAFNGSVVTITHNLGFIPALTMFDSVHRKLRAFSPSCPVLRGRRHGERAGEANTLLPRLQALALGAMRCSRPAQSG